MGTLVERISRCVLLVKLDGNTAEDVAKGFERRLKGAPKAAALRRPPPRGGGETLGAARRLFLMRNKINKRILHNQK